MQRVGSTAPKSGKNSQTRQRWRALRRQVRRGQCSAGFRFSEIVIKDKLPIVEIIQRTLTNEPREDDGSLLLRRYKNAYLYERYMIMRAETAILLTAFIEDSKIMERKE